MGGICVSKEEKMQNYNRILKAQAQRAKIRQALENGKYAQMVKRYTQLYGRAVSAETQQFISDNYNFNYYSQTRPQRYPNQGNLTVTYRSSLLDRFESAHKNKYYTCKIQILKFDENWKRLDYQWEIKTPQKIIYYKCQAYFDEEDKFSKVYFNEQEPPYDLKQQMAQINRAIDISREQQNKKAIMTASSSNDLYVPRTDWNAHYNAQVQQSNAQFRQNMNKQAQEWNNYVTQKGRLGY